MRGRSPDGASVCETIAGERWKRMLSWVVDASISEKEPRQEMLESDGLMSETRAGRVVTF